MEGPFLRKYGAAATINFELFEVDGVDFRVDAVYAAGDVKLMKNEGAEANTTNSFTDEGTGYSLVLTATEMQAARLKVYLVDQTATKVWLDKSITIETYGHASAQHAFDLDTASTAQTGDSYARLGAPAGASVSADVATAQADLDTITDTDGVILGAAGVDLVWDEILTGATHNVATSAGRRLRNLETANAYDNGRVWVDTINGTAGTTPQENGTAGLPVLTWADAVTISGDADVGLSAFQIINGSAITFVDARTNTSMFGNNWTLALGGQDITGLHVQGANVSGTGSGGVRSFYDCIFGITSTTASLIYNSSFTATTSGGFTVSAAGNYRFINCQSGVPGSSSPLFTFGTGAINAEWRRWAGGITISGISADDVMTVGGTIGTITLNGADGTVEVRGTYKAIVDNRTGSPTLNTDGAIKGADVASILEDTGTTIPSTLTTIDGKIDTVDSNVDGIKAVTDLFVAADAEPTGVPAANETPLTKLAYVFMALRNKLTVTSSKKQFFNDGGTAGWEKDLSDDGTTYTETEGNIP